MLLGKRTDDLRQCLRPQLVWCRVVQVVGDLHANLVDADGISIRNNSADPKMLRCIISLLCVCIKAHDILERQFDLSSGIVCEGGSLFKIPIPVSVFPGLRKEKSTCVLDIPVPGVLAPAQIVVSLRQRIGTNCPHQVDWLQVSVVESPQPSSDIRFSLFLLPPCGGYLENTSFCLLLDGSRPLIQEGSVGVVNRAHDDAQHRLHGFQLIQRHVSQPGVTDSRFQCKQVLGYRVAVRVLQPRVCGFLDILIGFRKRVDLCLELIPFPDVGISGRFQPCTLCWVVLQLDPLVIPGNRPLKRRAPCFRCGGLHVHRAENLRNGLAHTLRDMALFVSVQQKVVQLVYGFLYLLPHLRPVPAVHRLFPGFLIAGSGVLQLLAVIRSELLHVILPLLLERSNRLIAVILQLVHFGSVLRTQFFDLRVLFGDSALQLLSPCRQVVDLPLIPVRHRNQRVHPPIAVINRHGQILGDALPVVGVFQHRSVGIAQVVNGVHQGLWLVTGPDPAVEGSWEQACPLLPLDIQRDSAILNKGNIPERRLAERLIASVDMLHLGPLALVQGDLDSPYIPQHVPGVVAHLGLDLDIVLKVFGNDHSPLVDIFPAVVLVRCDKPVELRQHPAELLHIRFCPGILVQPLRRRLHAGWLHHRPAGHLPLQPQQLPEPGNILPQFPILLLQSRPSSLRCRVTVGENELADFRLLFRQLTAVKVILDIR